MHSSSISAGLHPLVKLVMMPLGMLLLLNCWVAFPMSSRSTRAKIQATRSQIAVFADALEQYARDNGRLPTQKQGLLALVARPKEKPLPPHWRKCLEDVSSVPEDPWGNEYVYESPGPHGEPFLITSYGADGQPGGRGHAADITSTQPY